MRNPSQSALGAWSGGRFIHFGEEIEEQRLVELLRPGNGIDTLITADAYGAGAADEIVCQSLTGVPREDYCLVGAVGHDFYDGERRGAKGFQRFTDAELRGPDQYASYLRMATERSLERCGVDHFDLLLLHNPDRIGYTSEVVWKAMAQLREEGLTGKIGVAPGPANGFTLDIIDCFERFGEMIDWAMVILNPFEPWPSRLVLPAAERYDVSLIARVVDYGGIFHGDVAPGHDFPETDHRRYRPGDWVESGSAKLDRLRPIAERHGLTPLQLACQWTLAQPMVRCVAPTLIQEGGEDARAIEEKRAELAALPSEILLTAEEIDEINAVGENAGCMTLKGAAPDYDGDPVADQWPLDEQLVKLAARWEIDPEAQLRLLNA
ncbi:MAG: aldo/keto reductase [Solirubrobacteraceae bacterium]|nr:aldo/keto reductase [Solirubrobacteraceae bacterium]